MSYTQRSSVSSYSLAPLLSKLAGIELEGNEICGIFVLRIGIGGRGWHFCCPNRSTQNGEICSAPGSNSGGGWRGGLIHSQEGRIPLDRNCGRGGYMQRGSPIRSERKRGPDVWRIPMVRKRRERTASPSKAHCWDIRPVSRSSQSPPTRRRNGCRSQIPRSADKVGRDDNSWTE